MIRYVFLGILIVSGLLGFLVVALVEPNWPTFAAYLAFVAFESLLYGMAMDIERRTPETESREQ